MDFEIENKYRIERIDDSHCVKNLWKRDFIGTIFGLRCRTDLLLDQK